METILERNQISIEDEMRHSYLESYVENSYSELDYNGLRKDSEDFHRMAQRIHDPASAQQPGQSASPKPGSSASH